MQPLAGTKPGPRAGFGLFTPIALAALVGTAIGGCGPAPGPTGRSDQPFAGVTLTVSCPDPAFRAALTPLARSWAARTGAAVEMVPTPPVPDSPADIAVIGFANLGALADRGDLVPVPTEIKNANHPYQWLSVLPAYRSERFTGWGGQTLGLPLAGDGAVLVYRADRLSDIGAILAFETLTGKNLVPPATWEDLAELAGFFTWLDGRPALPALPDDPAQLSELFFRIAACYDRPALGEAQQVTDQAESLSFQFHAESGRGRLDAPGFRLAADQLARLRTGAGWVKDLWAGGRPADPVAALLPDDGAVLAVLSIGQLGRLRDATGVMPTRFGVAPLPGVRVRFDRMTGTPQPGIGGVNYIPYFAGGKVGAVRTRCVHPEAAFDLLTDLGGPGRSLDLVGNPAAGAGPYRDSHLDPKEAIIWLGYGFGPDATTHLREAVRRFVSKEVRNSVYGLRTPDQELLNRLLATELKQLVTRPESAEAALRRVADAWKNANPGLPPEKLTGWRRHAVGLN